MDGDRVMDRRTWLMASFGLLATPLLAAAQPPARVFRVGLLGGSTPTGPESHIWAAFFEELRRLGYVEGQNVVFEGRYYGDRSSSFPPSRPSWSGCRWT